MKSSLSARTTLLIIAGLFFFPLILAWLMWNGVIDFSPVTTRNKGELVQPPVPVTWKYSLVPVSGNSEIPGQEYAASLEKHWVILHVVPNPCSDPCLETISTLRQVHKAAGRNQSRIRIVLLMQGGRPERFEQQLREIYPAFHLAEDPGGRLLTVLDQIATTFSSNAEGSSYVADPIGNIMLYYEAGSDPNNLKDDLKRLLTWSKLDK